MIIDFTLQLHRSVFNNVCSPESFSMKSERIVAVDIVFPHKYEQNMAQWFCILN